MPMSTKAISPAEAQLRARSRATLVGQRRAGAEAVWEALRVEQAVVRERTANLRALRLAKEMAEVDATAMAPDATLEGTPAKAARKRRAPF
jgi:hypothetical protein